MRRLAIVLAALFICAAPLPAAAQGGLLPARLQSAGVTQAKWDAVNARVVVLNDRARRAEVSAAHFQRMARNSRRDSSAALRAVAEHLLLERPEAGLSEILTALDRLSEQLAQTEADLALLKADLASRDLDAQVRAVEARLDDGDLAGATEMLAELLRSGEMSVRTMARGYGIAGNLAFLQGKYVDAAAAYRRAQELTPPANVSTRQKHQAHAVLADYNALRASASLDQVRVFRDTLADLTRTLETDPDPLTDEPEWDAWLTVHASLAQVEDRLGILGDSSAYLRAVRAYEAAKRTPNLTTEERAGIEIGIGNAWLIPANSTGDPAAVQNAITAFSDAVSRLDPQADQIAYVNARSGIAMARFQVAKRQSGAVLLTQTRAVMADLGDLIPRVDREADPATWLSLRSMRAVVAVHLAEYGDLSQVGQAEADYLTILEMTDRGAKPIEWAEHTIRLAALYRLKGRNGDTTILHRSRELLEAARGALSSEGQAFQWAWVHYELGRTSWSIGYLTDSRSEFSRARVEFSEARRLYVQQGLDENVSYMDRYLAQVEQASRRARGR
jgi:tetratricopeptide (TPR) repeat protein